MGFRKDNWASVWSIEDGKNNSKRVRLSTSKKNKLTGEYEQDFSGYCSFYGTAAVKAATLKPKDRIKLGDVDVTTWFNKEKNQEFVIYKVFDFETVHTAGSSANGGAAHSSNAQSAFEGDSGAEDLPF